MLWSEYKELAKTTALPNALKTDYLIVGLMGEHLEVTQKMREKSHAVTEIAKEYGDCLWFLALLDEVLELNIVDEEIRLYATEQYYDNILETLCSAEAKRVRDGKEFERAPVRFAVVEMIRLISEDLLEFESTIDQEMERNLDKLFSRKSRGVISGSGDNR